MLLETFHKNPTKTLCTGVIQNDSKTLRFTAKNSCLFILVYLDCSKHHEINIHLCHALKHIQQNMA